jgi:hypothetical protein
MTKLGRRLQPYLVIGQITASPPPTVCRISGLRDACEIDKDSSKGGETYDVFLKKRQSKGNTTKSSSSSFIYNP